MNLIYYLQLHSKNLNNEYIQHTNIEEYKCFKDFIDKHYELNYMKKNNYIKYVKIIRQKIVLYLLFLLYNIYFFYHIHIFFSFLLSIPHNHKGIFHYILLNE